MKKNPCKGIVIHRDVNTLKKEILTMEEIKRLASTYYEGEDTALKRAFLFCCFTGIRWCDAVSLTYANVDFSARILGFNQQKTEGRSAHSGVTIPLSPALLKLIGNPAQHTSEKIFNITCYRTTAITRLQKWVKAAGINKTITWHCARHSFAVNVLGAGANIKTVASLMGHSSIKCRGVRVYFSNYPHAHLALLHTIKMPKCQKCQGGVMCRNSNERKNQTVQECKECTGHPTNKSLLGDEKNIVNPILARYLPSCPKGVSTPDDRLKSAQ